LALAVLVLIICYPPSGNRVAAQAEDFGFRFEVGDCLPEKFDSFSGAFSKKLGVDPAASATFRLSLTDAQMRMIYQTIQDIRFFDYPSQYLGVPEGVKEVTVTTPADTYRLEVRNNGVVHVVVWRDAYKPVTVEADRLRALLLTITGFIHDRPELRQLPTPALAYE